MNSWTLADVRFYAHDGLKPDIAAGPKGAESDIAQPKEVKEKPPEGGVSIQSDDQGSSDAKLSPVLPTAISHEANACEAEDHHRPG
jgi:hypothetical protein